IEDLQVHAAQHTDRAAVPGAASLLPRVPASLFECAQRLVVAPAAGQHERIILQGGAKGIRIARLLDDICHRAGTLNIMGFEPPEPVQVEPVLPEARNDGRAVALAPECERTLEELQAPLQVT